jgi:hypothetical protein
MATEKQIYQIAITTEVRLPVVEANRDKDAAALPDSQRAELERRLADSLARPDAVTPWIVIKANGLARARG